MESGMSGFVMPTKVVKSSKKIHNMMKQAMADIKKMQDNLIIEVNKEHGAEYGNLNVCVKLDKVSIHGKEQNKGMCVERKCLEIIERGLGE